MPGRKLADQQSPVKSHLLDHPVEGLAGGSDEAGCLSPPEETGVVCLPESRRRPEAPLLQRLADLVDQSVVPAVAGKRGHAEPTLLCRYRGGWRRIALTEVLLQDIDPDADDARLRREEKKEFSIRMPQILRPSTRRSLGHFTFTSGPGGSSR